jgi:hypothetical protein
VGQGATGNVSVTTPGGTITMPGFTFLPVPTVTSFTPSYVKKGSTVTITGTNFTNASLVSFGNQPTLNFTVVSPTLITAVVGNGADGYVSVTNSNGSGSLFGLVYVQVPLISPSGLTEFTAGTSVNLTAQYGANQSVKWFKDGVLIAGATSNSLNATESGVYTLTATYGAITETSPPVTLHAILPASSFKVAATSVTCKGSNNGIITVTATQNSNYRAIITSSGLSSTVNFSTTGSLPNLAPGTYNVCISPTAALSYQQCYTIIVTEPKDLALYAAVNDKSKTVSLTLTGGNSYNITINGSNYVSTSGIVTLPLAKGDNAISVTSDKICQGVLEKHIYISDDIAAYPNPFGNNLTLNLGSKPIANVVVVVLNAFGQQVYTNHFVNKSGEVVLDLSKLAGNQVYVLRLTADNSVFINKIVKK